MAKHGWLLFYFFSSVLLSIGSGAAEEERKVHIVYMGSLLERDDYSPLTHHMSLLQDVVDDKRFTADYYVRSYKRSFNGFVAKLTDKEAQRLAEMEGVLSVFPSQTYQLHTTRSWDFIGLPETTPRNPRVESDVIIGVLDTGIWPESASFSDNGFGPPPKKWKGACKGGQNFTCNNKLIGARYYSSGSEDARDDVGHGSHTASTAAGNIVKDVSFYGLAQGNGRGGAPLTRIAAYKVCDPFGCANPDILAAFDDAIADGVDIISLSLGPMAIPIAFDKDAIAIGGFHAMMKGILVSNSAGNSGPYVGTTTSTAPWVLSVAASSIDRQIIDKVLLGNGKTIIGRSINAFTPNGTKFPIVHGSSASSSCKASGADLCLDGCLDSHLVKGKIVLCDNFEGNNEADKAGAGGSISPNGNDFSSVVPLPSLALTNNDYLSVKSYAESTKEATASILKSEATNDSTAPLVASFSSRGPVIFTVTFVVDVLKPDVTAPGVEILAAWPPSVQPSLGPSDSRHVKFNIISGTSMACPHVSGVAAYIKSFHPDWSPAAIKSAIMTTARPMDATKHSEAELAYGSGQINPVSAVDPGLIYDLSERDYIKFLCGWPYPKYDDTRLTILVGHNVSCTEVGNTSLSKDLNYPAMIASLPPGSSDPFNFVFNRTVTNVGLANSTYTAKIFPHPRLNITLVPQVLSFTSLNEKKSFTVTVTGKDFVKRSVASASLVWSDRIHSVRSPIVIHDHIG